MSSPFPTAPRKRDDSIYRLATRQPSYAGYRLRRRFPRFLSKLIIAEQTFDAAWDCDRACGRASENFQPAIFNRFGTGKIDREIFTEG